jgi:hypothetical protein
MLRPLCRAMALSFAGLGLALWIVWAFSRTVSDAWRWSQYLYWVPQEAYLIGALVLLFGAFVCARLGGFAPSRKRRAAWCSRAALGVVVLILIAHTLFVRWRVINLATRAAPRATPAAIRVMNWNCTAVERTEQIVTPLNTVDPDLAVLVNPHSGVVWRDVTRAFGAWNESRSSFDKPAAESWDNGIIVLSRFAITREASISLGIPSAPDLDPDEERAPGARADPGRAAFFELDTRAKLGHTLIVWVIDMPSDPRIARTTMMTRAARAIADWTGPIRVRDDLGRWHSEPSNLRGFPTPDLVMGDFNTPRGSASIRRLVKDMTNAFDRAGVGYVASWPRRPMPWPISTRWPLLGRGGLAIFHLDQMFLGPSLDALRYDIVDPGFGYHRMQVAELIASDASRH